MTYELVIIGAGLVGLRAATIAQDMGINDVLVVDYEKNIGGFGSALFNRNEFEEEKKLIAKSKNLPFEFWHQSTVVGFFTGENGENHQISIQTPSGTKEVEAKKVLFSTGSLEKPRETNRIAGARPAGVMTPIMALNLIERGFSPGTDCIVIENNKTSKAIADLLEEKEVHVQRIPGESVKITNIAGNSRVTGVEIINLQTKASTSHACDTLVYSEGTIPCTFYLKGTEIELDNQNYVIVDDKGRTNIQGIIALGSCTNKAAQFDAFSDSTLSSIKAFLTA